MRYPDRFKLGDFQLIIAGDGIRSDMHTIAEHLGSQVAGLAQLALLEIQLWHSSSGATRRRALGSVSNRSPSTTGPGQRQQRRAA